MSIAPRKFAFLVLAGLALTAAGCNSNKSKIVGKWKMVSIANKDGKEQKMDLLGVTPLMEFTSDGNIKVGADMSGMSAELKEMMEKAGKDAAKANEMQQVGKYKVSGDMIEFVDVEKKGGDSPFGKSNKLNLKIDGDTMTWTGEDGTIKFSRMK